MNKRDGQWSVKECVGAKRAVRGLVLILEELTTRRIGGGGRNKRTDVLRECESGRAGGNKR